MIKEIIAVFALIMTAIWTSAESPSAAKAFGFCAAGLIAFSWRHRGDSGYNLGLCPIHVAKPGLYLCGLTAAMALVIFIVGNILDPYIIERRSLPERIAEQALGSYFLWGIIQQLLLQGYFTNRLGDLFKGYWKPALASGVLFAIVHLPNPVLSVLTFVWGFASAYFFLRYSRNVYFLGLAHGILGTMTKHFLAVPLIGHGAMRVGPGFWN